MDKTPLSTMFRTLWSLETGRGCGMPAILVIHCDGAGIALRDVKATAAPKQQGMQ
jgi:hypothetical protein